MQSAQEELDVIQAAQAEKDSLLLADLQNPDTILVLSPNQDQALTMLSWQALETLCMASRRALQDTAIESFLIRLELEKLRLHQGWMRRSPSKQHTGSDILLNAVIVSAEAIIHGQYYWIEVAV